MRLCAFIAVLGGSLFWPLSLNAGPAPEPGARVILLGARWCAPCMAEYRELPALVGAAAPDRIVLAWVDRPMPVPAGLAGQVTSLPASEARTLAVAAGGQGFGLPMAVIERDGRQCRAWRRPLRPDDLPALRRAC